MVKTSRSMLSIAVLITTFGISGPSNASDVQVSVFSFPNLNGTTGAAQPNCDNENENLAEIVELLDGYTVDTTIDDFTDTNLRAQLDASRFFFMTDMENQNPDNTGFFPSRAQDDIEAWTSAGGVMVMTGTGGDADARFLNNIYGWDTSSVSDTEFSRNDANATGTPFETFSGDLTSANATDAINKGTTENWTTMWGTDTEALVAVVEYGRGYVIYLGFDFFSTGYDSTDPSSACSQNGDDWVQEIIPAALQYATTLADTNRAPATPAPYTGPLISSVNSAASRLTIASGDQVTVSGERLSTVSKVTIDGKEAVLSSSTATGFSFIAPEGLTPGTYDLVIYSSIGNLTYLDAFVVTAASIAAASYGDVKAWTQRISDTQAKVYVKYPTIGEKIRISHQTGGSGPYETIFVKTIASESDSALTVNSNGSYIVRTIDLEDINRIRVTVGDNRMVQVRYNN